MILELDLTPYQKGVGLLEWGCVELKLNSLSGPFSFSWFLILYLHSLGYAREKLSSLLKGTPSPWTLQCQQWADIAFGLLRGPCQNCLSRFCDGGPPQKSAVKVPMGEDTQHHRLSVWGSKFRCRFRTSYCCHCVSGLHAAVTEQHHCWAWPTLSPQWVVCHEGFPS